MKSEGRILVWGLSNNRAGTEAVIFNYAQIVRDQKFDFLTFEKPDNYGELFSQERGGGNRYFTICPKSSNPIRYYADLNRFMKVHANEYKALWFNTNHAANIDLLKLAKRFEIPRRIVHSHNSQDPKELILRILCRINSGSCTALATERWACSTSAGRYLFGDEAFRVVPNIVDSTAYSYDETKRLRIRTSLGIDDSLVIGTVGGLVYQKNQAFLLDLLSALVAEGTECQLVIVGEGELRQALADKAANMGLSSRVHLVGSQPDVQAYLSAFDVFVFPSRFEGLPVSLLEAQFNGVPCVCSDAIPDDAIISSQAIKLSLENVDPWVKAVLASARSRSLQLNEKASMFDLQSCRQSASELFA